MGAAANIVVGPATLTFNSVDLGFTKDGVRLRMEREYVDVMADQAKGVVKKEKALERFYVATTLLEHTLANLLMAWDQPTGSLGSPNAQQHQLVVVGLNPNGLARTFTLPRAISHAEAEVNYGREEETAMEVEFECLKGNGGSFGTVVDTAP